MESQIIQGQVDRCIGIFLEAAHWGRANGKNLWSDDNLKKENLLKYYKESEFYLYQIEGKDAGAMVIQWEDTLFWPEFELNTAGYLHKLCVRREFSGQGVADTMIDLAVETCKSRNINKLRLDTGWENKKLRALYERNGFVLYDKYDLGNQSYFARYELRV